MDNVSQRDKWTNRRIIFLTIGIAVIVAIVWNLPTLPHAIVSTGERLTDLLILFIAAIVFAYVIKPAVDFLAKLPRLGGGTHRARMAAALIVLLSLFAALGGAGWWTLDKLTDEYQNIRHILKDQTPKERRRLVSDFQQRFDEAMGYYRDLLPFQVRESVDAVVTSAASSLVETLSERAKRTARWLRLLVELVLVPVLAFYFLSDASAIRAELWLFVPPRHERRVSQILLEIDRVLNGYVRGQIILCGIAMIVVTLAFLALGLKGAFSMGLLAGLFRAIPYIGPVFSTVPLVIAAGLQKGLGMAVAVLIGSSIMHFIESKFVMPKVIGHEIGLHPVTIIFALMVGWAFFGMIGMFLAAPVMAMVKVVAGKYRAGWEIDEQPPAAPTDGAQTKRLEAEEREAVRV